MAELVDIGEVFTGSSTGRVVKGKGGQRKVGPRDVVLKITHCGLCSSDTHMLEREGMVLGHEPVGVVVKAGKDCVKLKVGDRAGFGCIRDSCLTCDSCVNGHDQICRKKKAFGTHDTDMGGWGDTYVINEHFAHRIPDSMTSEDAAVFQCAGATVLGALQNAGVKPFDRVGVWSIGGLGHLAIQFAAKMGCHVTAYSTTSAKRDEAMRFGATEFIATKEAAGGDKKKQKRPERVNVMLVCTSVEPDWQSMVRYINPRGTIVPVTLYYGDMTVPYLPVLGNELRIVGSMVCGRGLHQQMLDFAARHKIKPQIELLPMTTEGINESIDRMNKGDVRYRFVLVNQNNKELAEKEKSRM